MASQIPDVKSINEAFNLYFKIINQTGQFTLNDFMQFMEPRFAAAGYRQNKSGNEPANILILNDAGVGDFVVTSGAIREIRRLYPKSKITMIIFPTSFELAEFCPYVDEIIVNPRSSAPYNFATYFLYNVSFVPQLLERHFDICFNFGRWQETFFLMYMSGASVRITYDFPDKERDFMPIGGDVPVMVASYLASHTMSRYKFGNHMADVSFSLVDNLLLAPVANREIEVWYTPFEIARAKEILKGVSGKIYALCMGGEALQKHYPPQMYAKVVDMILTEEPNSVFVILGGGKNDLTSAEIFIQNLNPQYHNNILNFVNKITYRQSGAILKMCTMYIGNDTGTMHIAAAVKCPVLMPKCHPMDIPIHHSDTIKIWLPYKVPNVNVQPRHALPECVSVSKRSDHGCNVNQPHCITQINPQTLFIGFKILQKRIEEKNIEPIFIG